MYEILLVVIVLWIVSGPFVEAIITETKYNTCPIYSPSHLYELTKMNWFGCWFCFIMIRLLIPLGTAIGLGVTIIYYSWHFIKWLFTVGRKDDK